MPNAISYIRFSSVIQGDGSSTERQETLIGNWLGANPDYKLSTLSAKDLGRSAYDGEHLKHGLGEIIRAIKEKRIVRDDVILVEAFDRLGRLPPTKMFSLIQEIIEEGINIITLQDNQIYSEEILNSDRGSLFILVGKIQQAHDYSKSLGERVAASYVKKRIAARNGIKIKIATPFWLSSDGSIKKDEGEAVRDCIDLYLKGRGTRRVLLDLREKYPVLNGVHPSTLKRWFKNRALIGEWENKGDPIKGVFSPLIDESTYYALQRELRFKSKTMSPEVTYFLSGLVTCQSCGSNFHYRRKLHKDYVIKYGNCCTYLKRGAVLCANNKTWPYEVLYYIFTQTYRSCLLNISAGNVVNAANKSLNVLNHKHEEVSNKLKKFVDSFGDTTDLQEVRDKIDQLSIERKQLQNQIDKTKSELVEGSDSLSGAQLNEFLKPNSIVKDEIHFRELLKRNGYAIKMNGNVATVVYELSEARINNKLFGVYKGLNEMKLSEYELQKRSTKYNSYVVRQATHYLPDKNGSEEVVTSFCAIFRDGKVVKSQTETGLYNRLEHPDLQPEAFKERPWMVRFKTVAVTSG